jgi:type IV pilus assembly protein PilE
MIKKQRGMTLIELMIVVAIVAILASIALPAYGRYVMRAKRTDATSALLQIAAAQERFYLQNNTYAGDPADLGITGTPDNLYALTIAGAGAAGYTATATAQGSQAADTDCATFSINQLGQRTATGADSDVCWRR